MVADNSLTLEDERRLLVRTRIVRAALGVLSDVGVDATVEDIAARAGVGRRTIFRYFPTREQLLTEALESAIQKYLDHIPSRHGTDVWQWLEAVARAATEQNASYGIGYWQLVLQTDTDGPFGDALANRRIRRQRWSREVAREAWAGAGGRGEPPDLLVQEFTLGLGPFTTAGLQVDAQLSVEDAAVVAARLLTCALQAALEQPATGGPTAASNGAAKASATRRRRSGRGSNA
jgi:AcrR family transcriptional regulator